MYNSYKEHFLNLDNRPLNSAHQVPRLEKQCTSSGSGAATPWIWMLLWCATLWAKQHGCVAFDYFPNMFGPQTLPVCCPCRVLAFFFEICLGVRISSFEILIQLYSLGYKCKIFNFFTLTKFREKLYQHISYQINALRHISR